MIAATSEENNFPKAPQNILPSAAIIRNLQPTLLKLRQTDEKAHRVALLTTPTNCHLYQKSSERVNRPPAFGASAPAHHAFSQGSDEFDHPPLAAIWRNLTSPPCATVLSKSVGPGWRVRPEKIGGGGGGVWACGQCAFVDSTTRCAACMYIRSPGKTREREDMKAHTRE